MEDDEDAIVMAEKDENTRLRSLGVSMEIVLYCAVSPSVALL